MIDHVMRMFSSSGDGVETLELSEYTVNPGQPKTGPYDFELLKLLGKGGYGKVQLTAGVRPRFSLHLSVST